MSQRKLGLLQSTAINMIDMVGIGPFVVLPIVIKLIGNEQFLWAWIIGALISLFDALVWSELGTQFPQAGGSYNFLRAAYPDKAGKLMSFLYVWQTLIQAPLVVASGAIGFALYASYLFPFSETERKIVSGLVVIALTVLLYRKIETIGKISVLLWVGVLFMFIWIFYGATINENKIAINFSLTSFPFNSAFATVLGAATVKTIYSYLGYYNVCHLGSEIKNPGKIIPLSMFISIGGIAILYLLLNYCVVSVIPISEAMSSDFIVSIYFEKLFGASAANLATGLILWIAFASLFAVMLGYSRVPYAAAKDGQFFNVFAKEHPTKNFPYISLLFLGGVGFIFSLFLKLADVISAILAMRILIQFIGQAIGLYLLRTKQKIKPPFQMPLFPLPVFITIAVWLWVFYSTDTKFMLGGITVIALGLIVFFIKDKLSFAKEK